MTTEHEASRTLVKSPPELWAECSDAASLARHLGEFGEIKITKLEPETAVAWEGERASGTVRIEPSAWGTRVTLTVQTSEQLHEEAVPDAAVAVAVEEPPVASVEEPVVAVEDAIVVEEAPEVEEAVAVEESGQVQEAAEVPVARARLFGRMRAFFRRASKVVEEEVAEAEEGVAEEDVVVEADVAEPETPEPETVPVEAQPEPVAAELEPEPEPTVVEAHTPEAEGEAQATEPTLDPGTALAAALDSLGQAHHRPFSRA
jgi:hypothetical protein